MMLLLLPLLLGAVEASHSVYYAAGFVDHVTMTGQFQLAEANFSSAGQLEGTRNLTDVDAFMMGYVRVSPARDEAIYAAQIRTDGIIDNNVVLYKVQIHGDGGKPKPLIPDISALLQPCQHPSSGFPPCSQADLFHPYYDDTGDDSGMVLFGYRAWTRDGFPSGNQALAALHPDGSVTPLTFNASDIHTADQCPRFVAGSNGTEIVFLRQFMEGSSRGLAHLHLPSGRITVLQGPQADGWMGCPATVNRKYLYITSADKPVMEAVTVSKPPLQFNATTLYEVPRVDTGSAVDALSIQFCSHVSQDPQKIACRTSDNKVTVLDAGSGSTVINFTMPLPKDYNWCDTANSFHVWGNQ
eukprot:TRINITY_DN13885_c0_g1_i2.p1 TRINITY_DN13885_c0_g1~~TRINITY_DN13885_c0_g1_i2.p1  ORF type:complete len:355 (+),score=92.87 TRINITY_DN13885_c0_g1_i2:192-1256(+)